VAKYLLPGVYYKYLAYSGGGTKESVVKIKCEETVYCDRRRDLSHCVRSRIPNQNDHRSTAGYESAICLSHYDGYGGKPGKVKIHSWIEENTIWIEVADQGVGIGDVNRAMEPLFTTRPEMERSGMGFAFMEAFMDELHVESQVGQGTTIRMKKKIYSSFILS